MIRRLTRRARLLCGRFCMDLGDYRQSVLLTGTGRGGTTWLANILNHDNSYRLMFEPFSSVHVELLNNWHYKQYLRANNRDEKFLDPATRILSGNIRHPWIDKLNRKIVARRRIIKDIRTQFMLAWLCHNFPEMPIIMIVRHPCAVANSRSRLGWTSSPKVMLKQEHLMADWLEPFRGHLENTTDPFEQHVLLWCAETYVPMKTLRKGDVLLVFYEALCDGPAEQVERLSGFLGRRVHKGAAEAARKPSETARGRSAIRSGSDRVDAWQSSVSKEQVRRAMDILKVFGLDRLYGEGPRPLVEADDAGLWEAPRGSTGSPNPGSGNELESVSQSVNRAGESPDHPGGA